MANEVLTGFLSAGCLASGVACVIIQKWQVRGYERRCSDYFDPQCAPAHLHAPLWQTLVMFLAESAALSVCFTDTILRKFFGSQSSFYNQLNQPLKPSQSFQQPLNQPLNEVQTLAYAEGTGGRGGERTGGRRGGREEEGRRVPFDGLDRLPSSDRLPLDPLPLDQPRKSVGEIVWVMPAVLDLIGSCVCNIAFLITFASTVQMVRSFCIAFTCVIYVLWLRKPLRIHEALGILAMTLGLSLAAVGAILHPDESSSYDPSLAYVGIVLSLIGTAVQSFQLVLEERLFQKTPGIHPLKAVGIEGAGGAVLTIIALAIAQYLSLESSATTAYQFMASFHRALAANFYFLVACALFNCTGIVVTALSSSVLKAVLFGLRAPLIWLVEIAIDWRQFDWWNGASLATIAVAFALYLKPLNPYFNLPLSAAFSSAALPLFDTETEKALEHAHASVRLEHKRLQHKWRGRRRGPFASAESRGPFGSAESRGRFASAGSRSELGSDVGNDSGGTGGDFGQAYGAGREGRERLLLVHSSTPAAEGIDFMESGLAMQNVAGQSGRASDVSSALFDPTLGEVSLAEKMLSARRKSRRRKEPRSGRAGQGRGRERERDFAPPRAPLSSSLPSDVPMNPIDPIDPTDAAGLTGGFSSTEATPLDRVHQGHRQELCHQDRYEDLEHSIPLDTIDLEAQSETGRFSNSQHRSFSSNQFSSGPDRASDAASNDLGSHDIASASISRQYSRSGSRSPEPTHIHPHPHSHSHSHSNSHSHSHSNSHSLSHSQSDPNSVSCPHFHLQSRSPGGHSRGSSMDNFPGHGRSHDCCGGGGDLEVNDGMSLESEGAYLRPQSKAEGARKVEALRNDLLYSHVLPALLHLATPTPRSRLSSMFPTVAPTNASESDLRSNIGDRDRTDRTDTFSQTSQTSQISQISQISQNSQISAGLTDPNHAGAGHASVGESEPGGSTELSSPHAPSSCECRCEECVTAHREPSRRLHADVDDDEVRSQTQTLSQLEGEEEGNLPPESNKGAEGKVSSDRKEDREKGVWEGKTGEKGEILAAFTLSAATLRESLSRLARDKFPLQNSFFPFRSDAQSSEPAQDASRANEPSSSVALPDSYTESVDYNLDSPTRHPLDSSEKGEAVSPSLSQSKPSPLSSPKKDSLSPSSNALLISSAESRQDLHTRQIESPLAKDHAQTQAGGGEMTLARNGIMNGSGIIDEKGIKDESGIVEGTGVVERDRSREKVEGGAAPAEAAAHPPAKEQANKANESDAGTPDFAVRENITNASPVAR